MTEVKTGPARIWSFLTYFFCITFYCLDLVLQDLAHMSGLTEHDRIGERVGRSGADRCRRSLALQ